MTVDADNDAKLKGTFYFKPILILKNKSTDFLKKEETTYLTLNSDNDDEVCNDCQYNIEFVVEIFLQFI